MSITSTDAPSSSSHNAAIARMANRVLRLRDGRIVEDELNESPVAAAELDW